MGPVAALHSQPGATLKSAPRPPSRAAPGSPRCAPQKILAAGPGLPGSQQRPRTGPLRAAILESAPPPSELDAPSTSGRSSGLPSLLDRGLNVGLLALGGGALAAALLASDSNPVEFYQQAVASNPIETKVRARWQEHPCLAAARQGSRPNLWPDRCHSPPQGAISGVVYSLGDIIAQTYEGRGLEWDRARILRSGLCGLLAHGPLSHLYYLGLDHTFAAQSLVRGSSCCLQAGRPAVVRQARP